MTRLILAEFSSQHLALSRKDRSIRRETSKRWSTHKWPLSKSVTLKRWRTS